MPRRPRIFVAGGIYHVYCKTHRGELRFADPKESESFVDIVSDVARTHQLKILAWCLMSNHYHLVVKTSDVKLWRTMARIHGNVTRDHNRRHRVRGSSWQGRYRARLIKNDADLRHLMAYVHLNPITAGLANDPADYVLSGHREVIGRSTPRLVDVAAALRSFEGDNIHLARLAYVEHVRCVAEAKWVRAAVRELPWWQPVTDDHQTIAERDAPSEARTFDDRCLELPLPQGQSVEILLHKAAPLLGVPAEEIRGPGKRQDTVVARRRFTFVAVRFFDHSLKSIAKALGKSPHQVSRWLADESRAFTQHREEAARVRTITATLLRASDTPSCGPARAGNA